MRHLFLLVLLSTLAAAAAISARASDEAMTTPEANQWLAQTIEHLPQAPTFATWNQLNPSLDGLVGHLALYEVKSDKFNVPEMFDFGVIKGVSRDALGGILLNVNERIVVGNTLRHFVPSGKTFPSRQAETLTAPPQVEKSRTRVAHWWMQQAGQAHVHSAEYQSREQ